MSPKPTPNPITAQRQAVTGVQKMTPSEAFVETLVANGVTAIAAAYWAHSPVVIVTPETGTMGMGLEKKIHVGSHGDAKAALALSMAELMTCVRHDIPVTAVVFHNRQWGAEKKNQVDFYNRRSVADERWGIRFGVMRCASRCAIWTSTKTASRPQ